MRNICIDDNKNMDDSLDILLLTDNNNNDSKKEQSNYEGSLKYETLMNTINQNSD